MLNQAQESRTVRDYVFHCCGQPFVGAYEIRKHLFEYHREEYEKYFKRSIKACTQKYVSKDVAHYIAIQGEEKLYRKMRAVKGYDNKPSPKVGSGLHLIYTPMGNKK